MAIPATMAMAVVLYAAGSVNHAQAAPIAITNHSFELPDAGGAFVVQIPDGWLGSAGLADAFVEDTASVGMTGGDGLQYAGMDSGGAYIYQDLGVPFQSGMTYRVNLAGAHRGGFTHGMVEFGVFSSDAIGVDLGTLGFLDLQGVWTGSGNPDGDDMFDVFRDASVLQGTGSGALGRTSKFDAGSTPPTGNIVVFIRDADGGRINFDNIRLDESISLLAGDVDDDGDVDLVDFGAIRDNFRKSVASRTLGDLNEDGMVSFDDFREWKNNYPFPLTGLNLSFLNPVPEPTSAVLSGVATVVLCGVATLHRRRRPGPRGRR